MPRRSSGGRSSRSSRAAPAHNSTQPVHHASPPAPAPSSGSGRSFLGNVVEGLAFGAGASVGDRVVDAVVGPRTIQHETKVSQAAAAAPAPEPIANSLGGDACNVHSKAFQDCLNSYGSGIGRCQFYLDMLAECRSNSGAALSA